MSRKHIAALVTIAALASPVAAQADPANSMQPGHLYYGNVQSGQHPNRIVTLKARSMPVIPVR